MRYDIIKTTDYLLICDDSYINNGDKVLYNNRDILTTLQFDTWFTKWDFVEKNIPPVNYIRNCKKIIAHRPLNGAPYLDDVSVLPSLLKEDDVQKLADEASQKFKRNDELDDLILGVSANSFEEGYNKAREKYKFTEEDLRKAMKMAQEQEFVRHTDSEYRAVIAYTHSEMDIIKSLQQPKYPIAFDCEMERKLVLNLGIDVFNPNSHVYLDELKTITNSEGRVELVGKYIYE
jgi:hypothetical protein